MCGIHGLLAAGRLDADKAADLMREMGDAQRHRGPDGEGAWLDATGRVALGQRRLAILDLSPEGRQPMASETGRYTLTFNGEVYNHAELRERLLTRGHRFRGHSDTEVMLAAFEEWGLDAAIERFAGMFALALHDADAGELHLVRDRVGKKPLHVARAPAGLAFASEVKALVAAGVAPTLEHSALPGYLRYACAPGSLSLHAGVWRLPPASVLTLPTAGPHPAVLPSPRTYWSLARVAARPKPHVLDGDAIAATEAVLRLAVRERMVADVPLGAFLSGGIDSSLIVALMQAQSRGDPVKTFTVGFEESEYDEAAAARAVAAHLSTDHREAYVSAEDAMRVIPQLARMYDEPFADVSQIPTYLVARHARRHVTVALTGDGGDEAFGGYNRYTLAASAWRRARRVPRALRALAAQGLLLAPPRLLDSLGSGRVRAPATKLRKLAHLLPARDEREAYVSMRSHWQRPERALRHAQAAEPPTPWRDLPTFEERMMCADAESYLPDDVLTKVDRATMAVSLEARAPLLDHRVIEHAWSLPLGLKVRDGQGKWILRRLLARHVPEAFFERPKTGFGVPIGEWLRGPLRGWADALLDEGDIEREGVLDARAVRRLWRAHVAGRGSHEDQLWPILMLRQWLCDERVAP